MKNAVSIQVTLAIVKPIFRSFFAGNSAETFALGKMWGKVGIFPREELKNVHSFVVYNHKSLHNFKFYPPGQTFWDQALTMCATNT
jgi:hypothetical protein